MMRRIKALFFVVALGWHLAFADDAGFDHTTNEDVPIQEPEPSVEPTKGTLVDVKSLRGSRHLQKHSIFAKKQGMQMKAKMSKSSMWMNKMGGKMMMMSKMKKMMMSKRARDKKKKVPDGGSCDPDHTLLIFAGLEAAFSASQATIQVSWRPALFVSLDQDDDSFVSEACGDIVYRVFAAPSPYNYANLSIEDLSDDDDVMSFETEALSIIIDTNLQEGNLYDLLVIPEAESSEIPVSTNHYGRTLRVSAADPVIRSDVRRIVVLDEANVPVQAERLDGETIKFYTTNANELQVIQDLEEEDWVVGEYIGGEPFLVKLLSFLGSDESGAVWVVSDGSIADIFARLVLDASIDTSSVYSAASAQNNAGDGRRLLFDVDIDFDETEVLPIRFAVSAEVGIVKATFGLDFQEVTTVSVDIQGDIFGLDKFEIKVEVETTLKASVQLEFKRGTDNTANPPPTLTIWQGHPIHRTFLVGSVPVALSFTPGLYLVYDGQANLEAFITGKAEYTSTTKNVVSFDLDNGWRSPPATETTVFDGDLDIGGKGILEAALNFRLQIGILIYGTAWVAPFVQVGPYLSIEATTMPIMLQPQAPGFYFSKCDFGGKIGAGIKAEFRRDIPFIDEQEFKIEVVVERPFLLLTLPSASLNVQSFDQCVGDDAIRMVIRATDGLYTAPIPNSIQGPTEFLPVFTMGFDRDEEWNVNPTSDREVVLTLGRSVILTREFYEAPQGHLYYQTHALAPGAPLDFIFTLLFDQEMDELGGIPNLENFECCSDEDCHIKYGDDESELVCEDKMCEGAPTEAPTQRPTPSPTPGLTEEEEEDEDNDEGGSFGDPHMFTFDGLRYSCQAKGDFWLSRSLDSGMKVQGRFERLNIQATFTTGVVAQSSETSPIVEFRISEDGNRPSILRINGVLQSSLDYQDADVRVFPSGSNQYTILFEENGLQVDVKRLLPSFPHFFVNTQLPPSVFRSQRIVGLLGSPNDNALDDWTDIDGNVLPFAAITDRDGFDYCTMHWCIQDETESLFTYDEIRDFNFYSGCDDPYGGDIDLSQASPDLIELCGLDVQCLVDGIELGPEGAQNALEAQAILVGASTAARFRFDPAAIQVGGPVNVHVQVNLTDSTDPGVESIDRFNLYRTSPDGSITIEPILVALTDTGTGVDTVAGDTIFTEVLAVQSLIPGESFHFRAVPVIGGGEDRLSPFVVTSLNAVLSFAQSSGLGEISDDAIGGVIEVDTIEDLVLIVAYTWPNDQPDLDTGTYFLGARVGYGCGSTSIYLEFSGDNTSSGGSEIARVRLGDSYRDNVWLQNVLVEMHAHWHSGFGQGPASLTVYTEQTIDGVVTTSEAVSFAYLPGAFSGCSVTDVAAAVVQVNEDDSVTIQVINLQTPTSTSPTISTMPSVAPFGEILV